MAVTGTGQVLGILDQQCWTRPQPGQPGPEEKESAKWLHGLDAARAALHETAGPRPVPRLIHVMDREADAYEVMMAVVDAGDSAVIRCAQNRRIDDPLGTAHQAVRRQPVLGCTTVPVGRSAAGPPPAWPPSPCGRWPSTWCRTGRNIPTPGRCVGTWWSSSSPIPRRGPNRCIGISGRGAGGHGGRGAGGRAEVHLPVADRGDAPGAQERLPGRGVAIGDVGPFGESCDPTERGGGPDRGLA